MSKSIKLLDNIYWDTKGVMHNRSLLSEYLNTQQTSINTINSQLNSIGSIVASKEISSSTTSDQNNYINSLTVTAGTWIVFGYWRYAGFELSSWTDLVYCTYHGAQSQLDDQGYVNCQVSGLLVATGSHTVYLNLWPRGKSVSVTSLMYAIRIK